MPVFSQSELYRKLPSVDELIRKPEIMALADRNSHPALVDAARTVLARLRDGISAERLDADAVDIAISGLSVAIKRQLSESSSYSIRPVINATGVILHTNLGRAPLAANAIAHLQNVATSYSNLEFDLETGRRGQRDIHLDRLFRRLLSISLNGATRGASEIATIVVNNNAAAVLLAINTLAEHGEVIVSRGELVEIGGSFRIPDVMAKSLATLREVGTTNRTRIADYENAIDEKTRLLLRVHRSNFEIKGFTEQPRLDELVALSRKHNIPFMEDLGSGALFDLRSLGISGEPTVFDRLNAGVDVICFSGDKLLGGPQAGMLCGRRDLIARMRSNSLFRALRVDKLTSAALESTLMAYVRGDLASIPAFSMMHLSVEEIGRRASDVFNKIQGANLSVEIVEGESLIGGGAAPSAVLPTRLLALTCRQLGAESMAARLRGSFVPIIVRVEDGRVLLDLRTVFPEQDAAVVTALQDFLLG